MRSYGKTGTKYSIDERKVYPPNHDSRNRGSRTGKLKNAKVLIVGIGGLGSPISLYLTAAGVGQIGLIDDDIVSKATYKGKFFIPRLK